MPDIPSPCLPLQQTLDGLNARLLSLRDQLGTAPPRQKAVIIKRIVDSEHLIEKTQENLDLCIVRYLSAVLRRPGQPGPSTN